MAASRPIIRNRIVLWCQFNNPKNRVCILNKSGKRIYYLCTKVEYSTVLHYFLLYNLILCRAKHISTHLHLYFVHGVTKGCHLG
jgi:hypothetical protein